MKKHMQHIKTFIIACSLATLSSAAVLADDTEVYTGGSNLPSTIRPNLVFIIDTSGSMDTNVTSTTTNGTYDNTQTYTGNCDSNRIYWSTGSAPSCTSNNYINVSANKCNDIVAKLSGTSGLATGVRAARYRPGWNGGEDRWRSLNNNDHTRSVECSADWGIHGESDATNPYPADENDGGPWTDQANNSIDWTSTGDTYTFYSANYLNWRESATTTTTQTRLEIVQDVFSNLLDSLSDNINLAVMRYDNESGSSNHGGYFVMPMQQLIHSGASANVEDYRSAVNAFTASGYTPLSETLYEAYLYYRGDPVKFGDDTTPGTNHPDTFSGSDYISPIEYQCQKNFVILLTDGDPTYDTDADNDIEGLSGFSGVTGSSSCSGNCLDELADYMYSKDCRDPDLSGRQNVITYTIGFNTNQTLLQNAANKGGGQYYTADDTAQLTDAFTSIITDIMAINTSFIAPAVSVNAFNRFTHRDELYFALFKPDNRPSWDGNIKRFRLATPVGATEPVLVDRTGAEAVDPNTGFFASDAKSYWPQTDLGGDPDGDEVTLGGSAGQLELPRTVYTYTGAGAASDEDLSDSANALHEDNTAITKTMLGDATMSDTDRTNLLQWSRGIDLQDEDGDSAVDDIRRHMGDPLHSKPKLITYGGTDASPDITLFVGTNEGYLQAIDTSDGSETFSFVPQELLPNLATLYENSSAVDHPYGLDGPLTSWVNDLNNNGVIYDTGNNLESGEFVYLYQGMRRGGSNYYALDVTDRSAPLLKWVIKGGTGSFLELGQTWSAAAGGKVNIGGTDKTVLIFGGGYDEGQDNNSTAIDDTIGRAIYMVDANTGAKLWEAGPSDSADSASLNLVLNAMTNSIPSDITMFDIDGDGYLDQMYVGDMRGQVWRFDIHNGEAVDDLVTGGVIARLGDGTEAGNRRFYYAPDVSLSPDGGHLNISIGSGYRAHPLDTAIHDAFFVIRDENVYGPALDSSNNPVYTTITLSGLYDTTDNLIQEGTSAEIVTAQTALAGSSGFYIWMDQTDDSFIGEKVLAKSVTFDGVVYFSTFTPVATASSACAPSQGTARVYRISVEDGSAVYADDGSLADESAVSDLERINRTVDLVRGGIPPEPTIVYHDDGAILMEGPENVGSLDTSSFLQKTIWKKE